MHRSSNYSKGQFFVLTAFAIITILYFVSKWLQPTTIVDTSSVASQLDTFVFNNIVEKANETIALSNSCEDLKYNLGEYKLLVEKVYGKRFDMNFQYNVKCFPSYAIVTLNLTEISKNSIISSNFTVRKNW